MDASYENIAVTVTQGVASIVLNRPGVLNAISFDMARELKAAVNDLGWRSDVKVLVIKGAGRSFCAGYDVTSKRSDGAPREKMVDAQRLSSALEALGRTPVVRIAQLHGHVVGAGMALAMQCHLRYAAEGTGFQLPELNFGLPFLLGGASLLTRDLGPVRAADMILNCTWMKTSDPEINQLVTEVVPADELESRVGAVAQRLSARPEALLMATVDTIDRAWRDAMPPAPSDMFHGFFVRSDPETKAVGREYARDLGERNKS